MPILPVDFVDLILMMAVSVYGQQRETGKYVVVRLKVNMRPLVERGERRYNVNYQLCCQTDNLIK